MGTRADFYVGRTDKAEWLGSIAWDGDPEGIDESVKTARDEADFREAVTGQLGGDDSATLPEMGWPWPWEDSDTTDFAYAFDGRVWASSYGGPWVAIDEYDPGDEDPKGDAPTFPQMSTEDATLGPRSGLMVFQLGGER